MKRCIAITMLLIASFYFIGCGAYFTSSEKFEKGDWSGFASPEEAARIKQQKMAIEKMGKASGPMKLRLRAEKTDSSSVTISRSELERFADLDSLGNTVIIDFEKAGQPSTPSDSVMGYKGIVANTSHYATINTVIKGPETKSYLLPPGFWIEDYLIPGTYVAESSYRGQKFGSSWKFTVGLQIQSYMGKKVYWYTYCDY